jgi:hypothetical protein
VRAHAGWWGEDKVSCLPYRLYELEHFGAVVIGAPVTKWRNSLFLQPYAA